VAAHPAAAATSAGAAPWRGPTPGPRPQLCRRADLHGPHLYPWSLLPAKELGCGGATTCGGGRLRIRSERSSERFDALAMLACAMIFLQDAPPSRQNHWIRVQQILREEKQQQA
jgi:hypothetical protein